MLVTQKTLARRLGVSASLVSRALRGQAERIGARPATIRRIRRAARAAGYVPNAAALSLRGGATRSLGVVVKDFADPFFGPIIGELQRLAAQADYSLVMTGACADGAASDLAALRKHRLDGLILVGSDFCPPGMAAARGAGVRIVRLGHGPQGEALPAACVDEAAGLRDLLGHLRGLGHRRIGYLGDASAGSRRREALLRELLRPAGPAWCRREAAAAAARHLLAAPAGSRPTAVIAADDVLALALLRSLHEAGVRVPRDLSVAGADDIPFAHLAVPALTTLRAPVARMAARAFALATVGGAGGAVRPALVVRESCAEPGSGFRIPGSGLRGPDFEGRAVRDE